MKKTIFGKRVIAVTLIGAVFGLSEVAAQETTPEDPAMTALENKVEALSQQLAALQQQLNELKAQRETEQRAAEIAAIKQAAHVEAAKGNEATQIDTTQKFVSGTRMQPQLNPEISATGDIFFVGGNHQAEEIQARHFELDIQSYLDPYTFFHLVLGFHGNGRESEFGRDPSEEHEHHSTVGVGEAYVSWLNLPGNVSLTVGKKRAQFGVLNRWHLHALDQVDAPLVLQESFGEHGLTETGLSVNWLMPRLWADTNELTFEVFNGDSEKAFAGEDWRHPSFLARLKSYWDLTSDSYLEIGLDAMHGKADEDGRLNHDFYAMDFAFNWYPAGRELYRDFTLRGMLLYSDLDLQGQPSRNAWGGFVYSQMKFSPHWIAGLRYDSTEDQREEEHHYWGFSPYLTFWQSEFVRLRAQYSYRKDNLFGTDHAYTLQLTVAAGPHKHDSY
jgi:hypothetical protein